jgi:alkylation response protein AidB-like acyl-CoA dehydrogenase
MGIAIADEHVALAEAVRGWAGRAGVRSTARALADAADETLPAWWPGLAGQGLLAVATEAAPLEVAVVAEALGHALAPGPYLPTALVALLGTRHSHTAPDLVAGLADGSLPAAVGFGSAVRGERTADGVRLEGTADCVLGAATARVALLAVDLDGAERWWAVDTSAATPAVPAGADPTRRTGSLSFEGEIVAEARELCGLDREVVLDVAAVLFAAEAAGIAGWCLDTAVEHAKVREQFGRPIGAFQAVKHRCADMLASVELARAAAWDAAQVAAGPHDDVCRLTSAVAAGVAVEAAVECAKSCIQLLGGIGYTWEHDAHLYLKRSVAVRQLLGGTAGWQRRAARAALSGVRRERSVELPEEAETYRAAVRELIDSLDGVAGPDRRRRLADSGYLVPHWPAPYGRDAGSVEQLVIDEELARAGIERPDLVIGNWALPTILQFGTDAQRERFVPPTLYGEVRWCQMFSEPGAGSDLASLQTKAVRVEGGWSLSGQKVWTSTAHYADWAICLARTGSGERPHEGITYFLVDMRSQGIEVRPLRELTGEALFNEIFLTDVFVPDDCVVGAVGDGWRLARTTLANERVAMSSGAAFPSGVENVAGVLASHPDPTDPGVLERVGALVCRGQAESMLGLRATLAQVSGTDPGAASSVRKLVGMHLRQDAAELALELLGPAAVTAQGEAAEAVHRFLATRALTIAGGTSEVLHNVIGERILGLPRG